MQTGSATPTGLEEIVEGRRTDSTLSDRRLPAGYLLLPRPASTARETASPGGVYSAGQVRDLAWTRPFDAVSRLSRETRRSDGSPEQQVSGRSNAARSDKVKLEFFVLRQPPNAPEIAEECLTRSILGEPRDLDKVSRARAPSYAFSSLSKITTSMRFIGYPLQGCSPPDGRGLSDDRRDLERVQQHRHVA
jgi:hypothetical protein